MIVLSGIVPSLNVIYLGVLPLGAGTGLSTVANLSLMFDLTLPGYVGLFIGAWGFSNALSRLVGSVLGGIVRDIVTQVTGQALSGYLVVFAIEAGLLLVAVFMLKRISLSDFRQQAEDEPPFIEKVALAD